MDNEVLSKNLRTLRRKYNLTQDAVAKMIGKNRSLIAKYESGAAVPPLNVLKMFARLYNLSVDALCNPFEENEPLIVFGSDSSDNKNTIYYNELTDVEKDIILKIRILGKDKMKEIYDSLSDDAEEE